MQPLHYSNAQWAQRSPSVKLQRVVSGLLPACVVLVTLSAEGSQSGALAARLASDQGRERAQ
jgi:hypothetical protein